MLEARSLICLLVWDKFHFTLLNYAYVAECTLEIN